MKTRAAPASFDACLILCFFTVFYIHGLRFYAEYPNSYTWSELLINDQGGFVRRALVGEIAYELRWLASPQFLLTGLVLAAYGFCLSTFTLLTRRVDTLTRLIFLLSPTGLLFPIYDQHAFGRKDVFILAAFAAAALICTRPRSMRAFAALLAIYIVTGFVIETAWFYLPIAVALYTSTGEGEASSRQRWLMWTTSALVLMVCFGITIAANHAARDPASILEQRQAIVASWRTLDPVASYDEGPLQYLAMSPLEGVEMALREQGHRGTLLGYFIGLLFSLLPTALLCGRSRSNTTSAGAKIAALMSLAVMSTTFLIGADWGRYIYLLNVHVFIFSVLTRGPASQVGPGRRPTPLIAAAVLVLYGSTWRLKHYAWEGNSALVPGALFLLLRTAPK